MEAFIASREKFFENMHTFGETELEHSLKKLYDLGLEVPDCGCSSNLPTGPVPSRRPRSARLTDSSRASKARNDYSRGRSQKRTFWKSWLVGRQDAKDDVSSRESFCRVGSPVSLQGVDSAWFIGSVQNVFAEALKRPWCKVELMAAGKFQWLRWASS